MRYTENGQAVFDFIMSGCRHTHVYDRQSTGGFYMPHSAFRTIVFL